MLLIPPPKYVAALKKPLNLPVISCPPSVTLNILRMFCTEVMNVTAKLVETTIKMIFDEIPNMMNPRAARKKFTLPMVFDFLPNRYENAKLV